MALSIRNPECERLARLLSKQTGRGMTEEILTALRERVRKLEYRKTRLQRLRQIAAESAALPTLDCRTPEVIIGYDDNGAFTNGG